MKKFAVVLSGCGVYDGSEIHEAVLCMLAMSKLNIKYDFFAPDINQYHVINHLDGEVMDEKRNMLIESARIARGDVRDIDNLNMEEFDAILFPGGFGAAKNLSTYAFEGINMKVIAEIEKVINEAHELKRPIGALCISPMIIAKVLNKGLLTLGLDKVKNEDLKHMGAEALLLDSDEVCVDKENNIFTVAAYMNEVNLAKMYDGIEKLIVEMSKN